MSNATSNNRLGVFIELSLPELFRLLLAPDLIEPELIHLMSERLGFAAFGQAATCFEQAYNNLRGLMPVSYRDANIERADPVALRLTGRLATVGVVGCYNVWLLSEAYILVQVVFTSSRMLMFDLLL